MQNVTLLGEQRFKSDLPKHDGGDGGSSSDNVVDICHVETSDGIDAIEFVTLTSDGLLSKISRETGDATWTVNLEEVQPGGGWFNVAFVDPDIVCLSKNGAIVTISPTTAETEVIGVFDYGLEAASWSPDMEVLLMVTSIEDEDVEGSKKSVLLSMNSQFEVLAEVTIPNFVPSSDSPATGISVCWRPDGSLAAVSSVDKDDNLRKVKIYKRDTLELQATGRAEDASGTMVKNLQPTKISWAGPGCSQVLASVQRKGKKTTQVVFFESNGLRHREFVLREKPSTNVLGLSWNVTSEILAISLREEGGTDKVQLWHRCNYYWYLKREFRYDNRSIMKMAFSEENASELSVILNGNEWREYEVRWDPSTAHVDSKVCRALVVDGSSLHVTALEKSIIPPPMSLFTIDTDHPVSELCTCTTGPNSGSMVILLSNGNLRFLFKDQSQRKSVPKEVEVDWGTLSESDVSSLRSLTIAGSNDDQIDLVAAMCSGFYGKYDILVEITLSSIVQEKPSGKVSKVHNLEGNVLRIAPWADSAFGCLIELKDGSLLEYEKQGEEGGILPMDGEPFLEPCPWLAAIKDASPYCAFGQPDVGQSRVVFGLSERSRLYYHDLMIADSASSIFLSLSHAYLCYTTTGSRGQLRFVPLRQVTAFDPLMGMDQNQLLTGYEPRNVEMGARLVAIVPSKPMAVLQMPRGNLEGNYPRALVLQYVMKGIASGGYGNAFQYMRKHKVDMNLLVDFNPTTFLNVGIEMFLCQVENIDHLNLFISALQNWDVTKERFPIPSWFEEEVDNIDSSSEPFDFSTKVNEVCRKARSIMQDLEEQGVRSNGFFLLPILSTYAKETPPRLDLALQLIKDNALKVTPTGSKKNPLFTDTAQQSIQYLAFLADYELLFSTALGMYDFELARGVARNSQMDPKIYLPLLKRLNALPVNYGRYEVDVRLKRFDLALKSLFESYTKGETVSNSDPGTETGPKVSKILDLEPLQNDFANCLSLIQKHSLHKLGLELFQDQTENRREIYLSLGERMLGEGKSASALSVFMTAQPAALEQAKRAARAAKNWRCYFTLVGTTVGNLDDSTGDSATIAEQRRQAAREIAEEIIAGAPSSSEQALYADAARILLDYGDDVVGAVDMLINGGCWMECHRVATSRQRPDLVKRCKDASSSGGYKLLEEFRDRAETFVTSNSRYFDVLKLRKQSIEVEGPSGEVDDSGSLFSAASNVSNSSLRSTTSTASTGSATSSVISVKSTTTFTMTGDEEVNRHRSKFNKGKKQKKPKKKKGRKKQTPEEEVKSLSDTLRTTCPDEQYADKVTSVIEFLLFSEQIHLAKEVFVNYEKMCDTIERARDERIEKTQTERTEVERLARIEGENCENNHLLREIPIEKEVDNLRCAPLPERIKDFMEYN